MAVLLTLGWGSTGQAQDAGAGAADTAFNTLMAKSQKAEQQQNLPQAIEQLSLAIASTSNFPKRDTAQVHLREVVKKHAGSASEATLDSLVDQQLDQAFQTFYDRSIPVSKAAPPTNGRVVVAEYITGLQCGPCWLHDRTYAALLQRYPSSNFVVLTYHGGPGLPIIASDAGDLWSMFGGTNGVGDKSGIPSLYTTETLFGFGDIGVVDGEEVKASLDNLNGDSPSKAFYQQISKVVDAHLQVAPHATIALTVTPSGVAATEVSAVAVQAQVTPSVKRQHLGVRILLVEDTVRVVGLTNRRLQYSAVREMAFFKSPEKSVFSPLPENSTQATTITYTFDVTKLQQSLLASPQANKEWAADVQLRADGWRLNPHRLSVVCIVQDMDTKEILQTASQRILPSTH